MMALLARVVNHIQQEEAVSRYILNTLLGHLLGD